MKQFGATNGSILKQTWGEPKVETGRELCRAHRLFDPCLSGFAMSEESTTRKQGPHGP